MFKEIEVSFPGFKYPECKLRELSISQLRRAPEGDAFETMLYAVECGLYNAAGDKVITSEYTLDNFTDDCPQSFIEKLASAFEELNSPNDEQALEVAKNS
tara:strand:- start:752 stop:1051 length:300 start_codon:yes stop_codon:yes gene_type:complete